ncbi:MAG TPA: ATP-binding cassette domain-containing protein [Gemmatirosa sp.]
MSLLEVTVQKQLPDFALDVAFVVPGGVAAVVGPSGAGKTLTLRAVAGLLRPDAGRIACGGRVLYDADAEIDVPARARRVGYVFQQYALFPHLTVGENVAYALGGPGSGPRRDRAARVAALLALVGLPNAERRRPRELSGGQQQRVALARALAPDPALLLLDEPLAAVDAPLRVRLGEELLALHARTGVPMLFVTHDPAEARRVADVVIRLEHGRVACVE